MNPIATIIQNRTSTGRFANWTGSTKTWLPPNGVVEVPFEVWSVCDKKQRDALVADLRYGSVSLAVRILKPNGNYETIPFSPIANLAPQAPVQKAPVQNNPTNTRTEDTMTSNRHIVVAGGKEMNGIAQHFHLGVEEVHRPGVSDPADDLRDAIEFTNKTLQENRIEGASNYVPPAPAEPVPATPADFMEKQALEEQEEPEAPEQEEAPEEPEDASVEAVSYEDKIDELLSAKNYEEAHKLLVEVFGEEKITFKAAALRYTKTFDAVVKKYKLDA